MAERDLGKESSSYVRNPVVRFRGLEIGSQFIGTLVSKREVNTRNGVRDVYAFRVTETTWPTELWDDQTKTSNAVDLEENAIVDLWANLTVLKKHLSKAQIGETVRITFLGEKASKNGKTHYKDFNTVVLS